VDTPFLAIVAFNGNIDNTDIDLPDDPCRYTECLPNVTPETVQTHCVPLGLEPYLAQRISKNALSETD